MNKTNKPKEVKDMKIIKNNRLGLNNGKLSVTLGEDPSSTPYVGQVLNKSANTALNTADMFILSVGDTIYFLPVSEYKRYVSKDILVKTPEPIFAMDNWIPLGFGTAGYNMYQQPVAPGVMNLGQTTQQYIQPGVMHIPTNPILGSHTGTDTAAEVKALKHAMLAYYTARAADTTSKGYLSSLQLMAQTPGIPWSVFDTIILK